MKDHTIYVAKTKASLFSHMQKAGFLLMWLKFSFDQAYLDIMQLFLLEKR